jgi:hypothetical protein
MRMPLQNRVTPWGEIVAAEGRGLFMGNRGILHNEQRQVVRHSQVRRWIACRLEFRGRHRTVMKPHSYTELFFLDEATAFAAGHRPCAECRHTDYQRFRALWQACHPGRWNAESIDARLSAERLEKRAVKRIHAAEITTLPDGSYIQLEDRAWLIWEGELWSWSAARYEQRRAKPAHGMIALLTPPSVVSVFRAGYQPMVHASVSSEGK